GVSFLSATSTQGVCYFSNAVQTVFCQLGELPAGGSATVRIEVSPLAEGRVTNQAAVMAREMDLVMTNNIGKATVTVLAPPRVTTSPLGQSVACGGNATFTVVAAGSGPLLFQWRFNGAPLFGATNT